MPSYAAMAGSKNDNMNAAKCVNRENSKPPSNKIEKQELKTQNLRWLDSAYEQPTIKVTFQVLLSKGMTIPDYRVVILFGNPLSDWETVLVEMKPMRLDAKIDNGNYVFMVGDLQFPQELMGKTIPYKYVVIKEKGPVSWEYVFYFNQNKITDRCLIVPDVPSFVKYDDVILPENLKDKNFGEEVRKGRSFATRWMLPRPSELDDPNFDFSVAVAKFEQVARAHGYNGTRVFLGNYSLPYNPTAYSVEEEVRKHVRNFLYRLKSYLKDGGDQGKIFRTAIFISLVRKLKYCFNFDSEDYLNVFKAFRFCAGLLFDDPFPATINNEGRVRICEALKELVQDFVNLPVNTNNCQDRGNWVFAIPFIHRWDLPDKSCRDWLKLQNWKSNLRSR